MAGSNHRGFVLQPRDISFLQALDHLRVVDREQARYIGPFSSVTRANTRLLQLFEAGLLDRLSVGTTFGGHKYLYARTRAGAAAVRQTYRVPPWNANSPIVAGQPLLEHQLRLNELYFAFRADRPGEDQVTVVRWTTFARPPFPSVGALIPDAYVELRVGAATRSLFVEVDLATEPLKTWVRKTEKYIDLARSGAFSQTFGHEHFGVAVIVPSPRRLHCVRKAIASRTPKLFWLTSFDRIDPTTVWSPVWWRPTGDSPVFLN